MAVQKVKSVRSKRSGNKTVTSKTGVMLKQWHCRVCMQTLAVNKFYQCTDEFLDRSGFMSVCRDCLSKIYVDFYRSEKDMEKVLLRMCRILNVRYSDEAVAATRLHLQTQGKLESDPTVFGLFKAKIVSTLKENVNATSSGLDLTFHEPIINILPENINQENIFDNDEEIIRRWGKGLEFDDYDFLEIEFDEWKKTHKCDTKAEQTLLKEICYKQLEIKRARDGKQPVNHLIKDLQDIMKTANVDPAKANVADGGKSKESFSNFIRIIEENEPADYYKDKSLFKDYDNLDFYFRKYVLRPLKNFITQSRDFNVETDDGLDGSEEFNIEDEIVEMGNTESNFDKLKEGE